MDKPMDWKAHWLRRVAFFLDKARDANGPAELAGAFHALAIVVGHAEKHFHQTFCSDVELERILLEFENTEDPNHDPIKAS